tara:strand:- start:185 stop:526 length:342 start_codon:yes stop_codon:yes gene_type:complete
METRQYIFILIGFLRTKFPNNDFDAIATYISRYAGDKKISMKDVVYFWKKEKTTKGWTNKAILLAAIGKGWEPINKDEVGNTLLTIGDGKNEFKKTLRDHDLVLSKNLEKLLF